jgi:hypothetical protein
VEGRMTELTRARSNIDLGRRWWLHYRVARALGRLLSYIPNFSTYLWRAQQTFYLLNRHAHSELAFRKNRTKAQGNAAVDPTDFDSGYGYDSPAEDRRAAVMYRTEIESGGHTNAESPALYKHAIETLGEILSSGAIKRVVNFGVCFAYVDAQLAMKYPNVAFVGIDRSPNVIKINEEEFSLPNLQFFAGDVLDWISTHGDLSDTLLFHMRTTVLLPKSFVESLYRAAARQNIAMIAGFEPYGLSRETNDFYEQEARDKPSVLFRDAMYLHNYAGILANLGYVMERLQYVKTAHVDLDYRILSFVARTPEAHFSNSG